MWLVPPPLSNVGLDRYELVNMWDWVPLRATAQRRGSHSPTVAIDDHRDLSARERAEWRPVVPHRRGFVVRQRHAHRLVPCGATWTMNWCIGGNKRKILDPEPGNKRQSLLIESNAKGKEW
mmetsp:Transcript_22018/g.37272  ORF Transcript_22018/g.37272 Transcript_22018/m.37272 type:complete len:121 (-) Transcript_22018:1450-1812(-)